MLFKFVQLLSLVSVLAAASIDPQLCSVDGQLHKEFDSFMSGIGDCAKCVCVDNQVMCDATQCQLDTINQIALVSEQKTNDFVNIKNQLAKQYFSQFDQTKLKKITDKLGCKTTDCPKLLSATKIDYNVLNLNRQQFAGSVKNQNKIFVHTTATEAANSSPSTQKVQTVSYALKFTQKNEVVVKKTTDITSPFGITVLFAQFSASFKFAKTTEETKRESNETTIEAPSQKIVVEPHTRINVTFNFYKYNDINEYFLDFEIAKNSTITHPDFITSIFAGRSLRMVKKPFGAFLEKNADFLSTLTYEHDTDIKLVSEGGKFILKNFPATETLTNFGVDVVYGHPEEIK